MNRRRFIGSALGLGAVAGIAPRLLPPNLKRVEQRACALGGEVSLVAYHQDRNKAAAAIQAAFKALDELENVLSLYRPHSQVCQLNRDRVLERPHPDLVAVLGKALHWAHLTSGSFDPTVQPLWALYAARKTPSSSEIEDARRLVDWTRVELEADIVKLGAGQEITINGIAQGFAADRLREVFRAHGIDHALINTGEFCAVGSKPDHQPWNIGIQHPRLRDAYATVAELRDRFLATSGDYETKFSDDFSSHHIFDPATGRSPTELSSVTVLARTGTEADALSTAIFVLGASKGLQLAASRDVEAYLVLKNGDVVATPKFPTHA